jgi:hypothetical protein
MGPVRQLETQPTAGTKHGLVYGLPPRPAGPHRGRRPPQRARQLRGRCSLPTGFCRWSATTVGTLGRMSSGSGWTMRWSLLRGWFGGRKKRYLTCVRLPRRWRIGWTSCASSGLTRCWSNVANVGLDADGFTWHASRRARARLSGEAFDVEQTLPERESVARWYGEARVNLEGTSNVLLVLV